MRRSEGDNTMAACVAVSGKSVRSRLSGFSEGKNLDIRDSISESTKCSSSFFNLWVLDINQDTCMELLFHY